ncbi:MAG: hypothetical protein JNL57_08425 [Bacteroidetes bacterium]|nr:hypothetical protein [Bacteroidota bacterium]
MKAFKIFNPRRPVLLMAGIALFMISGCSREKTYNRILSNLTGTWQISNAKLRPWTNALIPKGSKQPEWEGQQIRFAGDKTWIRSSAEGDSLAWGDFEILFVDRGEYSVHLTIRDSAGNEKEKRYWEVWYGTGDKIRVYEESPEGELRLTLKK